MDTFSDEENDGYPGRREGFLVTDGDEDPNSEGEFELLFPESAEEA